MTPNHLLLQLRIGATVPETPITVIRKVVGARETNTTDAQGARTKRDVTGPAHATGLAFEECPHARNSTNARLKRR
jgi:hypothetical protein